MEQQNQNKRQFVLRACLLFLLTILIITGFWFHLSWLVAGLLGTAALLSGTRTKQDDEMRTEQKRTLHSLQESEQRYQELARQSRTFAWEVDINGTYIYLSPVAEDIIEYQPEELIGKIHYYDLAPEEDREAIRQMGREVLAAGGTFSKFDNRMVTKSGAIIWVESSGIAVHNDNGELIGIRGNDSDITSRKAAEAGMARLAAGIEQAGESVIITASNGTIQYVNPAFTTITGYTREEVIGQTPRILKSGTHDHTVYENMWRTITTGKVWRGRLINKRKDGTLYTQDAAISPVRDPQGKVVHYVAVTHDISENLKLHEQLMQAHKMESIGRLAGGVAHDFNNMLMGIMGYAELAREKLNDEHPAIEDLDIIHQTANRSATLTRQLLTFARKQSIQPKILNLNESIAPMLKMLARLIGESITLDWKAGPDLWLVRMDPAQIDQILANLCVNARDAMQYGNGNICITTHNVSIDELYCRSKPDAKPGEYVCCTVSDDGSGMPPEILRQIFDPFFTTKQIGKGTGLGLSTVYGILQQNNGFVHVYSEPGQGTTFKLYFPRAEAQPRPRIETQQPSHETTGDGITILLVEDEENVRNMTMRFLQRMQFTVLAATDAYQAIRMVEEHTGTIDIILTDMVMPGMNGKQMTEEIRKTRPDMQIIFMSGYTSDIILDKNESPAEQMYLPKPFTKDELAAVLQKASSNRK